MKPRSLLTLTLVVLAVAAVAQAGDVMKAVRQADPPPGPTYREGEVIVSFRPDIGEREIERCLRSGGAARARAARVAASYLVTLEPGMTVPDAVRLFGAMSEVDYAEANGILRKSQSTTFTPNDEFFDAQWNMEQVNAQRTWAIQKGASSVAVAILDTGVAYEDYVDPADGRVYAKAPDWGDVRFLPGRDTVNNDDHPNDDEFHGTHVASTVAEGTNNDIGVAGLAFDCAIMPVKVLDQFGEGTFFEVAEGIDFASANSEVKVINMSLGAEGFSQTVQRAVERAYSRGVVLVAAAGNTGREGIDFPASLPDVIAAGAVDARGQRASYSSTGSELELMGPGGDCDRDDDSDGNADCVFQQMPDPDLVFEGIFTEFCLCGLDGTSMASPHVAAAAALLISQGITDPDAVRAALQQTAEKIPGATEGDRTDLVGYGLIQPAPALSGLGLNQGPVGSAQ